MNGAVFALVANAGMAVLFAASFAVIAISYKSQRAALWFCASYLVGALTPISELFVRFSSAPEVFMIVSYASFLGSLLVMSAGMAIFHGKRPPWRAIAIVLVGGVALRALIWGGTRNTLPYELEYQLPFSIGSLLCCITLVRLVPRLNSLYTALAVSFGLVTIHFMAKPFFAVTFGSGPTAHDYAASPYALFSQASTGMLLVGTGLLVLLLVVQKAVAQSQLDAETDVLAEVANRRGFDRLAQDAVARAGRLGRPMSAVMFDLDHFKSVNDTYGHAVGDEVIAAFAGLLRRSAPQSAIIGRIGGEEFAMLLERTNAEGAWLNAQAIRVAIADLAAGGLPAVTVSGGVAEWRAGDSLADLMRRADQASYQAKKDGRDRICLSTETAAPAHVQNHAPNIVTLNTRRA